MDAPWLKYVDCPCCGERIAIDVSLTINSLGKAGPYEKPDKAIKEPVKVKSKFNENEQKIIIFAKNNGLLEALEKVAKIAKTEQLPMDMEKFFITVLKTSVQKVIPKFALNIFAREFGGKIDFYASQRIGMVLSDGTIRLFIPTQLVGGVKVRGIVSNKRINLSADEDQLNRYIKTKFGLVSGKGAMFEMMRNKSIGDFCMPNFGKYTT